MQAVPPELWNKIFSHASDEVDNSLDVTHHPWTTSQVCQQWREICHSTPQMWTELKLPSLRSIDLDYMKHRLACRLRYAQDQPLSITLSVGGQPADIDWAYAELLYPRRATWEDLILTVRGIGADGRAAGLWAAIQAQAHNVAHNWQTTMPQYPNLRRLSVKSSPALSFRRGEAPRWWFQSVLSFFKAFSAGHTPSLTQVCMQIHNGTYLLPPMTGFPWDQLEEFSISFVYDEVLMDIVRPITTFPFLSRLDNLVSLTLDLLPSPTIGTPPPMDDIATLEGLETLRIYNTPSTVVPHLSTPRLKTFITSQHPIPLASFIAFIRRSNCDLDELVISVDEEMEFYEFFELLPSLRKCSISRLRSNTFNQIVLALHSSSGDSGPALCPHLSTLTLNELPHPSDLVTNQPPLSPDHLAEMIEARWTTPEPLITAGTHSRLRGTWMSLHPKRVENWGTSHLPAVERLKRMREEGLDVDMITIGDGQVPFFSLVKGTIAQTTRNPVGQ